MYIYIYILYMYAYIIMSSGPPVQPPRDAQRKTTNSVIAITNNSYILVIKYHGCTNLPEAIPTQTQ